MQGCRPHSHHIPLIRANLQQHRYRVSDTGGRDTQSKHQSIGIELRLREFGIARVSYLSERSRNSEAIKGGSFLDPDFLIQTSGSAVEQRCLPVTKLPQMMSRLSSVLASNDNDAHSSLKTSGCHVSLYKGWRPAPMAS